MVEKKALIPGDMRKIFLKAGIKKGGITRFI